MLNQDARADVAPCKHPSATYHINPLNDHDYCSPNKTTPAEQSRENKSKRIRIAKEQDPAFTNYTSSDYSSSDAESDQESDYNSEDDPDRLWCICQKPHEGKFMIQCDICRDWFHGHCVGVTKLMGERFDKQGKEWFCGECLEKLRAGTPRNAISQKIIKKESKKKNKVQLIPGKRGRGRPRKSESLNREGARRVSTRATRKSSSSLDPKLGVDNTRLRKNLARSDARSESFDEFDDSEKLKELIKERKKDFFYKRQLAAQQKTAKRNALGLGRQSLTANLGDSLNSLATSTGASKMSSIPVSAKEERQKDRSKPNIVLQINTKKDSSFDQNDTNSRLVTTIVRSPKKNKHAESGDSGVDSLFTAEPIQISKKPKMQANTSTSSTNQGTGEPMSPQCDSSIRSNKNDKSPNELSTPRKKRKDSESSTPNGGSSAFDPKHIAQKIKESLETRCKQIKDLEVSSDKIEELANQIEGQLSECFKETQQKYLNKFRSLIFNLRDPKNQGLVKNVLTGEIPPVRLVRMSSDEMASHELAKWRERENKHSIELIKRDAQLAAQQVIVKKTHKGEEVISAPMPNESDDPTAVVDNQEPPTTPTKQTAKADGSKKTSPPTSSCAAKAVGSLKMKITGITSESTPKTSTQGSVETTPDPVESSLPFLDTTREHKSHIFDINCKVCTKQQTEDEEVKSEKADEPAPQLKEQPKRLRISIDTKLDPSNLSRLKEPLVKPILLPPSNDYNEFSPTRTSPTSITNNQAEDDDYDPEIPNIDSTTPPIPGCSDVVSFKGKNEPCWIGCLTVPDIPKTSVLAKSVSGSPNFMKEELSQNLVVCGRIAPDQAQKYIVKLKSTTNNLIMVIQLFPQTMDDTVNFDTLFDYLYSRNRYGVIQTRLPFIRDFYIIPVHEKSSVPEIVKPVSDIDRSLNCLLGLLVLNRRSSTSNSSNQSNYTPTPIE